MIAHVILEVSCHDQGEEDGKKCDCCRAEGQLPGYQCIFNNCPYMAFTDAPYEIAYSDKMGEINVYNEFECIGFGGDMEPENISEEERQQFLLAWKNICVKKIREAYEEYMSYLTTTI